MAHASVSRLRLVAMLEGISCLLLFGVAMPLKYLADMPLAVKIVGSVHGGLFLLFCLMLVLVMIDRRWPPLRGLVVFISSIPPFGAFIMDRWLKRWAEE